jgi:hypothetical protein
VYSSWHNGWPSIDGFENKTEKKKKNNNNKNTTVTTAANKENVGQSPGLLGTQVLDLRSGERGDDFSFHGNTATALQNALLWDSFNQGVLHAFQYVFICRRLTATTAMSREEQEAGTVLL